MEIYPVDLVNMAEDTMEEAILRQAAIDKYDLCKYDAEGMPIEYEKAD
jgi:hypothetical protein